MITHTKVGRTIIYFLHYSERETAYDEYVTRNEYTIMSLVAENVIEFVEILAEIGRVGKAQLVSPLIY